MKFLPFLLLTLLFSNCLAQTSMEPDFATHVKVQIKDEIDLPVEGVDAVLLFNHPFEPLTKKYILRTDASGRVEATDKISSSLLLFATKEGFYPIRFDRIVMRIDVDEKKITNLDVPVVMRRIKSPIALYAKKVNLSIPVQGIPIGFDLEAGDWIKPYGNGLYSDLFFNHHKDFIGYLFDKERLEELREFSKKSAAVDNQPWTEEIFKDGAGKWVGTLSMSFAGKKEGIALVDKDYCTYSELRMPHLAYEGGYQETWTREENTFSPRKTRMDIGYFLRTRVKLDEKGEIISANYAKLLGDIEFDPRGRIEFSYVFNPNPNDRNLEYNSKANLLKGIKWEEEVRTP